MKKKQTLNHKIVLYFSIWIVISSLYYLPNLLTGAILPDNNQSLLHSLVKYIACFSFSILLLKNKKIPILLLFILSLVPLSLQLNVLSINDTSGLNYTIINFIILLSFFGIPSFFQQASEEQRDKINKYFILSGLIVSIFSFIQYFFLKNLYVTYWENIASIRLVSTLLNPNSMGVYTAATYFLLISSNLSRKIKFLLTPVMLFSIIMSGSKTATISLIILISIYLILEKKIKIKTILIFIFMSILSTPIIFIAHNKNINNRLLSLETGEIRINTQLEFINKINPEILLPNSLNDKYDLIHENSYFMLINSLGIILCIFFMLFFFFVYKIKKKKSNFNYIVLLYLIVFSLSNFLNTYPNNLLFFYSLGSFITLRKNSTELKKF